uniref:Uncharacterized protein n=1 Tax=Lotharella globosa TaxID=91324 RepID=A0A6U2ZEM7_9EUKA
MAGGEMKLQMPPTAPKMLQMPPTAPKMPSPMPSSPQMKVQHKVPQQGWYVPEDKWGRFRFTKGAAKKGCSPTGAHPVWFCSKCKEEGKPALLPLSEFMPYGPECGSPNNKENNKMWSRYMLSGCVYLCKKHADSHIQFMKQRREEVASKKKEEAMLEASKQDGTPGVYKRFKLPKKQDLSMKKLQNALTNVLKKFSPKASIAVLMTHEDDPGNLASFHVGNALDSFCSDAYVRSLFLLCGSRQPQGHHLAVLNQGHDLILQQMQNITKQYGLLVRQLQNVTRQQQVQNITKQYGLIVSQLQNVANRSPSVLDGSVGQRPALQGVPGVQVGQGVAGVQGVQGVPGMPPMPAVSVTGMTVGVDAHGVAMPSAQLASQMPFVESPAVPTADNKIRDLSEKDHKDGQPKDMSADKGPGVPMDPSDSNKRQRDDLQGDNPAKRVKQ